MSGRRRDVCVYKLGGPALSDDALLRLLARELRRRNERAVLVHGGGRQVEQRLQQLGIESRFVSGRRATSPAAMEVVEMVLAGEVNKSLAARLTAAGTPAVGLSGRDAGLIRARRKPGLGCVGTPSSVDSRVLEALWRVDLLPVVAPVSLGRGGEPLNVNADEAALGLAKGLAARSLVYLSDVDGVRIGRQVAPSLTQEQAKALIRDGTIAGGMALKVRVALGAAGAGIPQVVIGGRSRLQGGCAGTVFSAETPRAKKKGGLR